MEEKKGKRQGLAETLYDLLQVFVPSAVGIVLVFTFVGRFTYVDGPSMLPTLHSGDMMVVTELFYTPRQGDVVVLTQPFRGVSGSIVKRVIATEGRTVHIDYAAGTVSVDGAVLDEPYLNYEPMQVPWYENTTDITVPPGHVFVMGDNRNHSNDSRDVTLGVIDTRRIIGGAKAVVLPIADFGIIR